MELPPIGESVFLITPARPDSLFNAAVRHIGNDLNGGHRNERSFLPGRVRINVA